MSELKKYRTMYFELFYAITTTISMLDADRIGLWNTAGAEKEKILEQKIEAAIIDLRKAQQKAEQFYIED